MSDPGIPTPATPGAAAKVLSISVTERGRDMARVLPFPHVHGQVAANLRQSWSDHDGFVLMISVGAAVRMIAPLLAGKATDPAVVCVDETGRFVVAVVGGHHGANQLAKEVAGLLGAQPVITTATDSAGSMALDALPGLVAEGDIAAVTTAILDGRPISVVNPRSWPLPPVLEAAAQAGEGSNCDDTTLQVLITDEVEVSTLTQDGPPQVVLHPPSLVLGLGSSTGPPAREVADTVALALARANLSASSVGSVATIDRRAGEPALADLGYPVVGFDPACLATVEVPNPSAAVAQAVGTASVAEAAALLGAGPGSQLVVAKVKSPHVTVAVARRPRPRGRLSLVGLGPGGPAHRTPAATSAVRHAEVVVGYGPYLDQCADLLGAHQVLARSPIGAEVERGGFALGMARQGRRVALVCSGDSGVYAMASITLELLEAGDHRADDFDLDILPGVTAALSAAAVLGAPLGHDHSYISLSDLLTPWGVIKERVSAAAQADMVVVFYNPRSAGRHWQLEEAMGILAEHRSGSTPVGLVADAGRETQSKILTTIADFDAKLAHMTTCVIVGSSTTKVVAGHMVTPRGYLT